MSLLVEYRNVQITEMDYCLKRSQMSCETHNGEPLIEQFLITAIQAEQKFSSGKTLYQ